VIAVGGPGGSGKSTFAKALAAALNDARVLRLDDYKTARAERAGQNIYGAHPLANDMAAIGEHLAQIRQGRTIDKPVYDRHTGTARSTEAFAPARFTIADGEVALYPPLRRHVDFAIFLDAHWRTQLDARLGRDLAARDYSPEKAVATFLHSNLREFGKYGADGRRQAHLRLFCGANRRLSIESVATEFAAELEACVAAHARPPLLEGLVVSLLTPFDADGAVDQAALVRHLAFLGEAGVKRVLVGGVFGEGMSLTPAERMKALVLVLEHFPGLVVYQTGALALPDLLTEAREAEAAGADAVLCLPPVQPMATAAGLAATLNQVADAVAIPFLLYHQPELSPNGLSALMAADVLHDGIVDCGGEAAWRACARRYFLGRESLLTAAASGVSGFFSSLANVQPEAFASIDAAFAAGRWDAMAEQAATAVQAAGANTDVPHLKRLLATRLSGYPAAVRLPLLPAEPLVDTAMQSPVPTAEQHRSATAFASV
jgi:dihydrodipicolinate synthase/N-acetylneuraminate lyase/uridine kinase